MARLAPLTAVALVAAACGGGEGPQTGLGPTITTAPGTHSTGPGMSTSTTSAEDSSSTSSTSSSGSTGSMTSGGIPDLGMIPDGGDGPPPGCKGKVDIVFTISSAKTMEDQQDELKTSFPGFIATLASEFVDFDVHILSTNTFGAWTLPWCADCKDTCQQTPAYPCDAVLEACDSVQGAGVTFPRGDNATNQRCDLTSGRRYITADQPDLGAAFTCIASMGTNGADQVAEATVKALAPDLNAPGGCNEGFVRPDALLVVVAIQDTFDDFSEGSPKDWADAIMEAKGGDGEAAVLLVITNDIDDPNGLCGYEPSFEHRLRTWASLVPHGLFRSMCVDDYAPHFTEAAARIKAQCDVFVPQ